MLLRFHTCIPIVNKRLFGMSRSVLINQKWRQERGLPLNPNAHGSLTDIPDYSYIDGRFTPYTQGQKRRILKQQELAERIITLTKEVDFAVARHGQRALEQENHKKLLISTRLKAKGSNLLKK